MMINYESLILCMIYQSRDLIFHSHYATMDVNVSEIVQELRQKLSTCHQTWLEAKIFVTQKICFIQRFALRKCSDYFRVKTSTAAKSSHESRFKCFTRTSCCAVSVLNGYKHFIAASSIKPSNISMERFSACYFNTSTGNESALVEVELRIASAPTSINPSIIMDDEADDSLLQCHRFHGNAR